MERYFDMGPKQLRGWGRRTEEGRLGPMLDGLMFPMSRGGNGVQPELRIRFTHYLDLYKLPLVF